MNLFVALRVFSINFTIILEDFQLFSNAEKTGLLTRQANGREKLIKHLFYNKSLARLLLRPIYPFVVLVSNSVFINALESVVAL